MQHTACRRRWESCSAEQLWEDYAVASEGAGTHPVGGGSTGPAPLGTRLSTPAQSALYPSHSLTSRQRRPRALCPTTQSRTTIYAHKSQHQSLVVSTTVRNSQLMLLLLPKTKGNAQ